MRKLSGYGPSLIVLFTAALVLFIGPKAVHQLTYEQTRTRIIQARHNLENTTILEQINQAYGDIATVVEPSVVHISTVYPERVLLQEDELRLSTGSGWIYDEDGHIVTNHHVIQNATRIDVQLYNGIIRQAEIVGSDPSTDVAVIKIDADMLHPALIADLNQPLNQGDLVFAFGSPFDFRFSMSSGVVSGKDRSVGVIRDDANRAWGYENFIQVDAAINPGNSGGPLTDYRGRVIGMNTAIATGRRSTGFLEEGQFAGIGLAIPIDMILPVVTQLIETGYVEKGFMGVETRELDSAVASQLGFAGSGVFVRVVQADGPARESGMRPSDIITHVGGKPVNTVPQLRSLISSMRPGQTAKLTIWRYDPKTTLGQKLDLEVDLAKLDTLRTAGRLPDELRTDSLAALGIESMADSTPRQAELLGIKYHPGVLIGAVIEGSSLARQISGGTIIVDVADEPVRGVVDFFQALRGRDLAAPGGVRALAITPDGQRKIINLRPEP